MSEQESDDLCPRCHKNPADGEHSCPFRAEIHDDAETLCNCCDECAYECAMDI